MAASTVAICGLARDCATSLVGMIPRVEALGAAFRAHRVYVVENDSTDGTGERISRWSGTNPNVEAIRFSYTAAGESEGPESDNTGHSAAGWFGRNRIERISFARNLYLAALRSGNRADYVIVIDLDIRSFSQAGIAHSFGLAGQWDAVTANGSRYSSRHPLRRSVYWDTYAYESPAGFEGGIQTPGQIRAAQLAVARELKAGQLIPARSAFGGLAIYRANSIAGHSYSVLENGHPEVPILCEHHAFHRSIRRAHEPFRLLINPHQAVDYGSWMHLARAAIRSKFNRK